MQLIPGKSLRSERTGPVLRERKKFKMEGKGKGNEGDTVEGPARGQRFVKEGKKGLEPCYTQRRRQRKNPAKAREPAWEGAAKVGISESSWRLKFGAEQPANKDRQKNTLAHRCGNRNQGTASF